MQLAIISDTHIPGQADEIPDAFREHIEAADHVVHAGDFGSEATLADVDDLSTGLTAVYGNADPNDIDLPAVASVECGGVTFVATHGIVNHVEQAISSSEGVVMGREDWLDAIADTARARTRAWTTDDPVVGIGGHSHDIEDEVYEGVRLLNPGSATGVGRADGATMMTAEVEDGDLDVTLHEA